ncbi:MAG: bifunctional nuclease family protein [Desulfovibrionaceae bacterium]
MVEMHVFGLALDEKSQSPVLILKDLADETVLPIWIGAMEAMAISLALNKVDFPRPMTHDLMLNVLAALGAELSAVEITRVEEGTFYAELVVRLGDAEKRVDCRPSDAIALAVRVEAKVLAARAVLEQAGTLSSEAPEVVLKSEDADKWAEELDKVSPDDFKYEM